MLDVMPSPMPVLPREGLVRLHELLADPVGRAQVRWAFRASDAMLGTLRRISSLQAGAEDLGAAEFARVGLTCARLARLDSRAPSALEAVRFAVDPWRGNVWRDEACATEWRARTEQSPTATLAERVSEKPQASEAEQREMSRSIEQGQQAQALAKAVRFADRLGGGVSAERFIEYAKQHGIILPLHRVDDEGKTAVEDWMKVRYSSKTSIAQPERSLDDCIRAELAKGTQCELVDVVCHRNGYEPIVRSTDAGTDLSLSSVFFALERLRGFKFIGKRSIRFADGREIGFSVEGDRLPAPVSSAELSTYPGRPDDQRAPLANPPYASLTGQTVRDMCWAPPRCGMQSKPPVVDFYNTQLVTRPMPLSLADIEAGSKERPLSARVHDEIVCKFTQAEIDRVAAEAERFIREHAASGKPLVMDSEGVEALSSRLAHVADAPLRNVEFERPLKCSEFGGAPRSSVSVSGSSDQRKVEELGLGRERQPNIFVTGLHEWPADGNTAGPYRVRDRSTQPDEECGRTLSRLAAELGLIDEKRGLTHSRCPDCNGSGVLAGFGFGTSINAVDRRCPCTPTPEPKEKGPEVWTVVDKRLVYRDDAGRFERWSVNVRLQELSRLYEIRVSSDRRDGGTNVEDCFGWEVVRIRGEHCVDMALARLVEGLNNGSIGL